MSRWLDRYRAMVAAESVVDLGEAEELAEVYPDPCQPGRTTNDIMHEDLRLILVALGLGDHARTYSPHEVVHREILPAIGALLPRSRSACCELPLVDGRCPNAGSEYTPPLRGTRHV